MRNFVCIVAAAALFSSCATIVSKTSNLFGVDTSPQGAQVQILNRKGEIVYRGQTPVTTSLKTGAGFFKRATYRINLSMEGYQTKTIVVDSHINGWYFGNIALGGVLGMLIIDPATGAMYKFNDAETQVDETLTPNSTSAAPSLKIVDLKDIPAAMRRDLVKLPG